MSLLEVEKLEVQYDKDGMKTEAVKGLSFTIEEGEIVGIVGESGCGKSSAMRALMGLYPETAKVSCKRLYFQGKEEPVCAEKKQVPEGMAMIFQDPFSYLNPTVKIGEQIAQAIRVHEGGRKRQVKQRVCELLDMVGIRNPQKRMRQYPHELSGGMRQRVVTAVALACSPKLIIADEPTTALDVIAQGQMIGLLKKVAKETNVSILLVSHDFAVIASMCERVYVMKEGSFVEEGPTEEVFYNPQNPYTREFLQYIKEPGRKERKREAEKETLLRLDAVTKLYPDRQAKRRIGEEGVRDISFTIRAGETFGLIGESGCGKSTLAKLITGQKKPDRGAMYYQMMRADALPKKKRRECLEKIQMVFQDPYASLNPKMTVGKALLEAFSADTRKREGLEACRKKVEQMLVCVGLSPQDAGKYPEEFSGGQRQRIGIARALIRDPEILVCDEAVSALDVSIQAQVLRVLEDLQKKMQIACLFISHDLHVIRQISQNVGVMYLGSLVECGQTKDVLSDPWHPYTKELLKANPEPDPKKARRKKYTMLREKKEWTGKGCPYLEQCGYKMERCEKESPPRYQFGNREVACFLYSEEHRKGNKDVPMTAQI
ncbi:ABC transporter ATP-binding protein [Faecalicatena acetigenes]|uniref:ABC transporter ATP-binding protein n=1 Tax=Faecalicatena acetigenes TaxID=2981790 RepID=A0ABT2T8F3_9FIRM|nr:MULTISPECIES: ABC transporter ATP-binding protein [Lachnospiraceae]MCU6746548.1 ABC transporter ATP-binding protein [Faecalicatena acetigenes]SCH24029.1 Glutathione import ATP-binding protein GsiA [uncultured Clostridium sp.]